MCIRDSHDIGKATPAFCTKKGLANTPDLDSVLLEKLEGIGFTDIKCFDDKNAGKSPHNIAGQYLLNEYGIRAVSYTHLDVYKRQALSSEVKKYTK